MTKENTRFYELKNEIHELRKKDLNTSLRVQAELNRMEDWSKTEFEIFHFDDEIAILKRGGKYYGLNHRDMNKWIVKSLKDMPSNMWRENLLLQIMVMQWNMVMDKSST